MSESQEEFGCSAQMDVDTQIAASEREMADLQQQIERVKTRLLQLKSTRNDLSAVSKLPTEVLCAIFTRLQSAPLECGPTIASDRLHRLHWTTVTHVCRLWRKIAIGYCGLWNSLITDDCVVWMENMLEWSKPAPISLDLSKLQRSDKDEAIIRRTLMDGERLQSVSLSGPPESCFQRLACLPSRTPKLSVISVREWPDDPPVTVMLMTGIRPHHLSWTSVLPAHLTSLSYVFRERPLHEPYGFFVALQSLRHLRSLKVRCAGIPVLPTNRIAEFPELGKLVIEDRLESCSSIVRQLRIPSTCQIAIYCEFDESVEGATRVWTPILASLWLKSHGQADGDFTSLSIQCDPYSMTIFHYRFWTEHVHFHHEDSFNPNAADMVWSVDPQLIDALFTRARFFNCITSFNIGREANLTTRSMVLAATMMPCIRDLYFEFHDPSPALLVLNIDKWVGSQRGGPGNPWLPNLESLTLKSISFSTEENIYKEAFLRGEFFLEVLASRARHGLRLKKLMLVFCESFEGADFHEADAAEQEQCLQQYVDEVVWDRD